MSEKQWERRRGYSNGTGFVWTEWMPCNLAEAMRVQGLISWQVRLADGATPDDRMAPSLLQQALEALELSQPLPGNESKWSAAINAIYAALPAGVDVPGEGKR
jgi:hypothetical protein